MTEKIKSKINDAQLVFDALGGIIVYATVYIALGISISFNLLGSGLYLLALTPVLIGSLVTGYAIMRTYAKNRPILFATSAFIGICIFAIVGYLFFLFDVAVAYTRY